MEGGGRDHQRGGEVEFTQEGYVPTLGKKEYHSYIGRPSISFYIVDIDLNLLVRIVTCCSSFYFASFIEKRRCSFCKLRKAISR